MKYTVVIITLLLAALHGAAQTDMVVVRFVDAMTQKPVADVAVKDDAGKMLALSDTAGYCTLMLEGVRKAHYLLASVLGYSSDTVRPMEPVCYLHPLEVFMSTAYVRSGKISKLLREPYEYVVDYLVEGDNILVATYSGNNGGKAKLFLINKEGDVLAQCKVPDEPIKLYKSCIGNSYCVCRSVFYGVAQGQGTISLKAPFKINLLKGLQQCDRAIDGNKFYRLVDRDNFKVDYGMIANGDSVYRPLMQFDESKKNIMSMLDYTSANASYEEYQEIKDFWSSEQYHEAYRWHLKRKLLDEVTIAHINMPLYTSGDSLIIFDYYKKKICYYSAHGQPLGMQSIGFEWKGSQRFVILKDEPMNRFYIHRYDNRSYQTLEELNIQTGMVTGGKILISKPLAEDVQVAGGDIYFLWHSSSGTRQMYVQREEMGGVKKSESESGSGRAGE